MKDHIPPVPPHNPSEEPGLVSEEMKHLAYGEASLMLIECLMLALIERGVLTTHEVIGAVEAAVATKRQMVDDGDQAQIASVAAGVLSTLANSLRAAKA